jgi:lauroyl/myristoyl acyltransferase
MTPPLANPQAPRVGWIRRLLGPFHMVGPVWYRVPVAAARLLPLRTWFIAELLSATAFFLMLVNVRRALGANLQVVLGPVGYWRRQVRAYRTLWQFSWVFGERSERLAHPERFRVDLEAQEYWEKTVREGKGAILVTAHVGAWEMSTQTAPPTLGRRVHVVREEELDPASQAFIAKLVREFSHPDCVTHFATDDPRLGMLLIDALKAGEVVALQGDRPRAGSRTVTVPFFGRPLDLPAGPAVLARASGAPLLPIFCFRQDRHRYTAIFREPIYVAPDGDRNSAVADATRRLGAEIEWAVRQHPHQWFCFGRLWE